MREELELFNFGVVICDECHYLKNQRAARTKVAGTPLEWGLRTLDEYVEEVYGSSTTSAGERLHSASHALVADATWPVNRALNNPIVIAKSVLHSQATLLVGIYGMTYECCSFDE